WALREAKERSAPASVGLARSSVSWESSTRWLTTGLALDPHSRTHRGRTAKTVIRVARGSPERLFANPIHGLHSLPNDQTQENVAGRTLPLPQRVVKGAILSLRHPSRRRPRVAPGP